MGAHNQVPRSNPKPSPGHPVRPKLPVASPPQQKGLISKKVAITIGTILATLIVVGGATGWWLTHSLQRNITTVSVQDGVLAKGKPLPDSFLNALSDNQANEPLNILVLGSDTRVGQRKDFGNSTEIAGARSDTAMIVHLSANRSTATVVSVPRDLWTNIPACLKDDGTTTPAQENRFNVAFETGGPGCAVQTVTSITGMPINHFVVIDFKGFEKIVKTLGGLPVCLTRPVNDEKANLNLPSGNIVLNGKQALGLARARYSLGDGSDISRIQRQQRLMNALIAHAKSKNVTSNPATLYKILTDLSTSVSVDPSLAPLPAMASLAWQTRSLSQKNITFVTLPTVDRGDGATVALNEKKAAALIQQILSDTKPATPTKTKKPKPKKGSPDTPSSCANPIT